MIEDQRILPSVAEKRKRILRLIFLLYLAGIIAASLMPGDFMPDPSVPNQDKVEHFLAYTGLGFLVGLTFATRNGRFTAALCVIGMGFLLEWGQSFVPGRDMSLADGLVNSSGILFGLLLFYIWGKPVAAWFDRYLAKRTETQNSTL
jgi:VanZ family protein